MSFFPGTVTVGMEWEPDPEVIARDLVAVANYLDDMLIPLRASQEIAQADIRNRFETESGPNGEAWAPLDEDYLKYKLSKGGPETILTWTGALKDAASSDAPYSIGPRTLSFDMSALPVYGIFHEHGSGAEMAGASSIHKFRMKNDPEYRAESKSAGEGRGIGIGPGHALPRRPFVGLSADAEQEIFIVFDEWFDAGAQWGGGSGGLGGGGGGRGARGAGRFSDPTKFYVRPSGKVQTRGAGGRFGPIIGEV